jgi:hypothetical protein
MKAYPPMIAAKVAGAKELRNAVLEFINSQEAPVTTATVVSAFGQSDNTISAALNYLAGRDMINVNRHTPFLWSKKQGFYGSTTKSM